MSRGHDLLQELIRVDTVNPPGNETRGGRAPARVPGGLRRGVRAVREGAGASEPRGADPRKGGGPRLLFLSHTDTVLADPPSGRSTPGRRAPGRAGVGARRARHEGPGRRERRRDRLARPGGVRAGGDLIFAATADEEVGEGDPLRAPLALPRRIPTPFEAEYSRERGRRRPRRDRRARVLPLLHRGEDELALRPRPRPERPCVAARHRGQRAREGGGADRAAGRVPGRARADPEVEAFLRAILGAVRRRPASSARAIDPRAADMVEPLLSMTVSPTMITASNKRNVIPAPARSSSTAASCPGRRRRRPSRTFARARPRRLRARLARGPGRDALAARRRRSGTPPSPSCRGLGARRACGPDLRRGIHRQPLAAGGVRHRRLRLLPDARDGRRARGAPDPLGRRARRVGRPRART